jgi:non-heme chloroperoxidase
MIVAAMAGRASPGVGTRWTPMPTLILHGDDDQIVPIGAAALRSSKLVKNATLKIYGGAPHGLADTHKDQLNADLLAFLKT